MPYTFTLKGNGATNIRKWRANVTCGSGVSITSPNMSCGSETTLDLSNASSATWKLTLGSSAKDTRYPVVIFKPIDNKNRVIGSPISMFLTLLPNCKLGDADCNGTVDADDYSHVDQGFNNHLTGWANGDFDGNGVVDLGDYSIIDQAFNNSSDTTPPTLSSVTASGITETGATVAWTTNEAATRSVEYGLTTSYGQTASPDLNYGTSHSVPLSGLQAGKLYHYKAKSKDSAGNTGNSGDKTFTTSSAPVTNYTITANVPANGTVLPSGAISVPSGGSKTFAITPSSGYKIGMVVVDGSNVGAVTSYTFSNVTANHTIGATFSPIQPTTYTITATAGVNGTVSPSGAVPVTSGQNKTFAATANAGYRISALFADGNNLGALTTYTFMNVTANHTFSAVFEILPPSTYIITASAGTGGTITPVGSVSVPSGQSKSFAIVPLSGYFISAVTADGVNVGTPSVYTFSNVTANHTISASFTPVPPPPPPGDDISANYFGAKPNDGVDDKAAIQAAIDLATSGKRVVFTAPGTYNLTSQVKLKGNITLTTAAGLEGQVLLDSVVPLSASNGWVNGTNWAFKGGNVAGLKVYNLKFKANSGIFNLNNADNTEFKYNDFQWGYSGNYYNRHVFYIPAGADGLKIENNYFHDSESSDRNLEIWGWANGSYSYNTFYKINDGGHIMNPGNNVFMKGNVGRLIHRMGIEVQQNSYPPDHWPTNFVIDGNVFSDWNKPYWDSMGLSVPLAGINVTIKNNYIRQNAFNGVWGERDSSGAQRGSYGIEGPQAPSGQSGGTITGNTVISNTFQGSQGSVMGVSCPGKNTTVRNNKFFGPFPWGVVGGEPGSLGYGDCGEWQSYNTHDPNTNNAPPPPSMP
jgi:hypothetical protein